MAFQFIKRWCPVVDAWVSLTIETSIIFATFLIENPPNYILIIHTDIPSRMAIHKAAFDAWGIADIWNYFDALVSWTFASEMKKFL